MKAEIKPRINLEDRTRLETVIPLSTPYLVFLDPSDICNAKCSWCPTGSGEANKYKKPQLMDFELYKKIIDDLCDMPEPIKTLRLYSDGEPLINDYFPYMIKYAKDTGRFGNVDSTTNGTLLNPILNWNLVASGLDKIFISVPQNYDYQYIRNVENLFQESLGTTKLYVKIIGDGLSELDKAKFMADFGDISDRIFIEHRVNCWPGFDAGPDPSVGIYDQPLTKTNICSYIFYSLKINSDGTVSLCYLDWSHQMYLGDLRGESFSDIWNGVLLKNIRKDHLRGYRMKVSTNCANCKQLIYGAPDILDPYAGEILKNIS